MSRIQEWIHALEEGGGVKLVRVLVAGLAFVSVALLYHLREFQNFTSPEAMDAAQVARNISEGKGFTTDFVRPFSLHLMREHSGQAELPLEGPHPDIHNAPLYPFVLAQLFKAAKPEMSIPRLAEFDDENPAALWRYDAEVMIALLNQGLFLISLILLYRLGRRLFDPLVAWVSVIALGGSSLFWQLSVSGLPTMLVVTLVLALAHCLVAAERGANENEWGGGRLLGLILLAGGLIGALALTQYSMAALLMPALLFVGTALKERRGAACAVLIIGFAIVAAPWVKRNVEVCGLPLGAAGFALHQDSVRFPGERLDRSLEPRNVNAPQDLRKVGVREHWSKFWKHIGPALTDELPRFGGSWMSAFFLVGLLIPFSRAGSARLRQFTVSSFGVLLLAQVMTRGAVPESRALIDPDQLIVALAPLAFLFGAAMFSIVLDQAAEAFSPKRNAVATVFCLVVSLPLVMTLLSPRKAPLVYPPYHPPLIQEAADWFEETDLLMSDMPWAVAWYGGQPCVWLTWDLGDDFVAIHNQKSVNALYLTSITMDQKLVSELWEGEEIVWGRFAANSVVKGEMPDGFPLRHAFGEWFPFQLLMADRPRWESKAAD